VIYFLPTIADYLFFLFVFVLFARSKKDYFWMAYLALLFLTPSGFFNEGTRDAVHRLPLFSLGPGFSFTTTHIFLFIGLGKGFLKNNKIRSYFSIHYKTLLLYLGFLAVVALVVHGTSFSVWIDKMRMAFNWSFIFVLYSLVDKRNDKYKLLFLLIPFTFFMLFDALYFMITDGNYFYNLFNPHSIRKSIRLGIEGYSNISRYAPHGLIISYIVFIFTLSFQFISSKKNYLFVAALPAFIVSLLAASRALTTITSLSLIIFFYLSKTKFKHVFVMALLLVIFMIPIIRASSGMSFVSGAYQRVSTLFEFGEETSESRHSIEQRIEEVKQSYIPKIRQSPIIGWGFTKIQGGGDHGVFGMIVNAGFLGFLIFLWFWWSYLNVLIGNIKNARSKRTKNALIMLMVSFLGILFSTFTTTPRFEIYRDMVFVGLIIFLSEFIISEVKLYDYRSVNKT
jgi:hypothetical protein